MYKKKVLHTYSQVPANKNENNHVQIKRFSAPRATNEEKRIHVEVPKIDNHIWLFGKNNLTIVSLFLFNLLIPCYSVLEKKHNYMCWKVSRIFYTHVYKTMAP